MSQSIEELLQAATPRPWRSTDDFAKGISDEVFEVNKELCCYVVNTYEARTELIRQLTEALEELRSVVASEYGHEYDVLHKADAALEAAKKARES